MVSERSLVYSLRNQTGYSIRETSSIERKVTSHHVLAKEVRKQLEDPTRLVASSAKIRAELGWAPCLEDSEKIIASAWNWHKNHPNEYGRRKHK